MNKETVSSEGPSVPQPQSKTQYKRLIAQGAIEPSVPVSRLAPIVENMDLLANQIVSANTEAYRDTLNSFSKQIQRLITEARSR